MKTIKSGSKKMAVKVVAETIKSGSKNSDK